MTVRKYKVQGLKEFEKALLQLDNDIIKKASRRAVRSAMEPVRDRAEANVPVSEDERTSGGLKKSVKLTAGATAKKGQPDRFAWAAVGVGNRKRTDRKAAPGTYALQVHYGTSKDPIQPFLLTAFVGFHHQVLADFKESMKKQIEWGTKLMGKRARRSK